MLFFKIITKYSARSSSTPPTPALSYLGDRKLSLLERNKDSLWSCVSPNHGLTKRRGCFIRGTSPWMSLLLRAQWNQLETVVNNTASLLLYLIFLKAAGLSCLRSQSSFRLPAQPEANLSNGNSWVDLAGNGLLTEEKWDVKDVGGGGEGELNEDLFDKNHPKCCPRLFFLFSHLKVAGAGIIVSSLGAGCGNSVLTCWCNIHRIFSPKRGEFFN